MLIITNNLKLYSVGRNDYGQLFLGNRENQCSPKQTSFSNILKVSAGCHSFFQNNKGEIYGCGFNTNGELGLGHNKTLPGSAYLILDQPKDIIQFCCGVFHSLFLDIQGNVYSVGLNKNGCLGLGHNDDQNILTQIIDIPPIQAISCTSGSSYLIDFDEKRSFGCNIFGQLGHDDKRNRSLPTKMIMLHDIHQICGSLGIHFLAKDSQNKIFITGLTTNGQLGCLSREIKKPREMNFNCSIWGEPKVRAKSARK